MQDNAVIEFGKYKSDTWYGIDTFENERFQAFLEEVKSKPELFDQHELYLTGGILEDWITWDVDLAITGPYIPSKILSAMTWITHLGFKHGIYPDVVYVDELFDLHEWQKDSSEASVEKWVYILSDSFVRDGVKKDMSGGEWQDGLYRNRLTFPYQNNIDAIAEGHLYKKALRVF